MRSILIVAPLAAIAVAACSAGAQPGEERASGEQGRRDFQVGAFQAVSLEGSHDVVVTVGGQPSVRAEGDAEALERLEISVENGSLRISSERRSGWSWRRNRGRVTVYVTAPALNAASIGGSGDMRIDRVRAEAFRASIGGSGNMEIVALQARRAAFSVAGSGNVRAAGQAEEADVSVAGSGDLALEGLATRRADVSIVGSGDVAISASESVDASIMGSGDVTVTGNARCTVSKMGSGDVHCANRAGGEAATGIDP